MLTLCLTVLAVIVGALLQRTTGIGFALVSGPALVLILNPFDGIVLVNVLSVLVCTLILGTTWREIDWRATGGLLLGVAVFVPLGALVARVLAPELLFILVGALTTVAVAMVLANRPLQVLTTRSGGILAGAVSGFSTVTAGIGGPALAVYAASTRMPIVSFVSTAQIVGLVTAGFSLVAKGSYQLPWPLLLATAGAVVLGFALSWLLRDQIGPGLARRLALILALAGGVAALGRGVAGVL